MNTLSAIPHDLWNIATSILTLNVSPPFSQRGWLHVVIIVVAALIIAGIFWGQLRAADARRRRLEALVAARTLTLKETNLKLQHEIVERQNAQEAAQRYAQTLAYLHQIVRQLTATLELPEVSAQLAQNGLDILETECLSVWLQEEFDGEKRLMCLAAARREHTPLYKSPDPSSSLQDTPNIIWDVIRKEQSVVINDVPDDPYYHISNVEPEATPLQSLLIVPLRVRDTTLGSLRMANKRNGTFSANDLTLAETLAAAAAIAIDNARLVGELRDYATDLESHVSELDAFALSVAHDLKNPLTILIGFSTVLEEEWKDMEAPDIYTSLQNITRTGRKMGEIIDALLLLARLRQTDRIDLQLLTMRAIVDSVQERLSAEIDRAGVQIDQPAEWPAVWGHPTLVEDVWFNYLSNALKYGTQSESASPLIHLGFNPPAERDVFARFWVRDNGRGLTPEARARLFTEFTRLEPTRGHGHGLGLSIVRRIVEKLGGEVGVESAPGEGSTFWFTLPRRAVPGGETVSSPGPIPPARD